MNNKGFTLIEVLAVVAILAIIGLIATPSVLSMINAGKDSSYEILIDNIRTGAKELYQEKEFINNSIYVYNNNGKTSNMIGINSNSINVNLQTLVSNGFLTGSNNDDDNGTNKNNKIVLEPYNKEDIGMCEIKIIKVKDSNSKVCYKIEGISSSNICPTTSDFGGDSQCTS